MIQYQIKTNIGVVFHRRQAKETSNRGTKKAGTHHRNEHVVLQCLFRQDHVIF